MVRILVNIEVFYGKILDFEQTGRQTHYTHNVDAR